MVFKPIPVSQFRINARHIAELMWGTGVTGEAYIGDLVQSLKAIDEAKAKRNGEKPHVKE